MINSGNIQIIASLVIVIIEMATGDCELYDSLPWSNNDVNFQKISGFYSVITTNIQAVFGACEVHGITQEVNGDLIDRYKVNGSPCPTVFQNRITKNGTVFQFQFFGNDLRCLPASQYTSVANLKMKVTSDGLCFFKSFCLPNGSTAVNLLCKKTNTSLLTSLLSPLLSAVVQQVLALLGDTTYYIDQGCYDQIINNQTNQAILLGQS